MKNLLTNLNKSRFFNYLAVTLWFVIVMSTVVSFSVKKVVAFDPYGDLIFESSSQDFDERVVKILDDMGIEPGSMVHIESGRDCMCDELTRKYRDELYESLEKEGFTLSKVKLNEDNPLRKMIISTPAVITYGHDGKLKYLGPYATGLGCFTGTSNVDSILDASILESAPGAMVNVDNIGCYCQEGI